MEMKKKVFDTYAKAIAKQFHITLDEMFDKTRKRECVDARQMLYYLCMERPIRISYIQRFMAEHGHELYHSTIIYGYRNAKKMIDNDQDFKDLMEEVKGV